MIGVELSRAETNGRVSGLVVWIEVRGIQIEWRLVESGGGLSQDKSEALKQGQVEPI